jgi:hypothetical protein
LHDLQAFIGTDAYKAHKIKRFRSGDNPNIAENPAFILADPETRNAYAKAFAESSALYYGDKPTFEQILAEIGKWIDRLGRLNFGGMGFRVLRRRSPWNDVRSFNRRQIERAVDQRAGTLEI